MNFCEIAVFIWLASIIHFLADLFSHWKIKHSWKFGHVILHPFLYTLFFIPLFWVMGIDFFLLIFVFLSHLIIDCFSLEALVKMILKNENENSTVFSVIVLGTDQALHLLALGIISFFV